MESERNARERLQDLLAEQVFGSLTSVEEAELGELLEQFPDVDPRALHLTASALELAALPKIDPLPPELQKRLIQRLSPGQS